MHDLQRAENKMDNMHCNGLCKLCPELERELWHISSSRYSSSQVIKPHCLESLIMINSENVIKTQCCSPVNSQVACLANSKAGAVVNYLFFSARN